MKKIIIGIVTLTFANFSLASERLIFQVKKTSQEETCHDSKLLAVRLIDENNDGKFEAIETQGAEPAIDLDGKEVIVAHYASPKAEREKINLQSDASENDITVTHFSQKRFTITFDGEDRPVVLNRRTSYTISADKKTLRFKSKWDRFSPDNPYARHMDIWLADDPEPQDGDVDECVYPILE